MEYVYDGASIECQAANVQAGKLITHGLVEFPNIGDCQKIGCKLNSKAKITKELSPPPPKHKYSPASHLRLADLISGREIVVYTADVIPIRGKKIQISGQHRGWVFETPDYCFAKITAVFPNQGQIKDSRQLDAQKLAFSAIEKLNKEGPPLPLLP